MARDGVGELEIEGLRSIRFEICCFGACRLGLAATSCSCCRGIVALHPRNAIKIMILVRPISTDDSVLRIDLCCKFPF